MPILKRVETPRTKELDGIIEDLMNLHDKYEELNAHEEAENASNLALCIGESKEYEKAEKCAENGERILIGMLGLQHKVDLNTIIADALMKLYPTIEDGEPYNGAAYDETLDALYFATRTLFAGVWAFKTLLKFVVDGVADNGYEVSKRSNK